MNEVIKNDFTHLKIHTQYSICEGALRTTDLAKYCKEKKIEGKTLIAINSGSNINFDRLSHIVERVQIGEKKEILLSVVIPEKKGSFRKSKRVNKRT